MAGSQDERDWLESLRVRPCQKVDLSALPTADKPNGHDKDAAEARTAEVTQSLARLQFLLYADARSSLLVVLQGLDAAGKDGTIRKVMSGLNPQGVKVTSFKQPTAQELAHDFLWRVHKAVPGKGEVGIFNRSHYEDVLVVRVHEMVEEKVWRARYDQINAFEQLLTASGTRILKFFLHISPEEQLERFAVRLNDPTRQWKISEADYTERKHWDAYTKAYEDALERTSTKDAPWYVIPADRKWVRNFAVARIIEETLQSMDLKTPKVSVDLEEIRRHYHAAVAAADAEAR